MPTKEKKQTKPIKYEDWLSFVTIVYDNQEKQNYWILDKFKDLKIPIRREHMKSGDYGFTFKGIPQRIIIERKNSITELSGNLSTENKKERFYKEFARVKSCEKYILIENDSIDNILTHTYGTKYDQNSFIANFLLLLKRYDIKVFFVNRYNMAEMILKIFYYHYYENFKNSQIK